MRELILSLPLDALLLAHAASTWFMTGVVWFVQLVHYPLMARVGREHWCEHQRGHQRWTTVVVMPAMFVELGAALALLLHGVWSESPTMPGALWLGAALLALIWLSTALVQVPLHARLESGFDARTHARAGGHELVSHVRLERPRSRSGVPPLLTPSSRDPRRTAPTRAFLLRLQARSLAPLTARPTSHPNSPSRIA